MKTKYLFITLLTMGLFSAIAFAGIAENEILGTWKYKISEVPVEYQIGVMNFEKKEDKTVGFIGDGTERKIEMKELAIKENKVSFKLLFESSVIVVNLVLDGDKMAGKLKTDDGEFDMNAQRQVKK